MAIPDRARSGEEGERGDSGRRALPFWPPPRDGWIAIAGVALLFTAHWLYGALINDTAMVVNIAAAALVGAALLTPRLRDDLLRLKGLAAPTICFALVILVALWTLTPWTPGGPHPVWAYVGISPGASTIDKSSTIMEIVKLLGLGCLFVVGAATGARDERARYAIRLTILVGVIFGLWAFLASVSGAIYQSQGRRLEAHFLSPNTAGMVFAVLLVLSLAELLRSLRSPQEDAKRDQTLLMGAGCLTFAVCLLDTASRGAMAALLCAGATYVAVQMAGGQMKLTRALGGVLAGMLALVAAIALAGEQFMDRLFQSHESSLVRFDIWKAHWQAFLASPLFGYGLGSVETVDKTLVTHSNYTTLWAIRSVHNVYLQWLEQAGLVGAAPMFLCIALVMVATLRGHAQRSRMTGLLAGLLAADLVILVHGATDFGLEVWSVAGFWAWLLGLQFSLAQGSSRR